MSAANSRGNGSRRRKAGDADKRIPPTSDRVPRFAKVPASIVEGAHPRRTRDGHPIRGPLSDRAVRLYAFLALHADYRTGECTWGRRRIASELDWSLDKVDETTKELATAKVITKHRREDEAGDPTSNRYVVVALAKGGSRDSPATPPQDSGHGSRQRAATVADNLPPNSERPERDTPEREKPLAPAAPARRPDPMFDALQDLYGEAPHGRNLRNGWNTALKELRSKGKDEAWIRARVTEGRRSDSPWAVVTPMALAKHADLPLAPARGRPSDPGRRSHQLAQQLRRRT